MNRRNALKALLGIVSSGLVFPQTAHAEQGQRSWYGDSFTLKGKSWTSPSRYYEGSNIGIEMTCSSSVSGTLSVRCCSSSGQCLGVRSFKYRGFTKATWSMPSPGTYYFRVEKTKLDTVPISSSDVKMYSW